MNCPKCSGIGRYYTEEFAGVKVHPCSCKQSMTIRQAQELQFINFLKRLNADYERHFGTQARSFEIGKMVYGEQFEGSLHSS